MNLYDLFFGRFHWLVRACDRVVVGDVDLGEVFSDSHDRKEKPFLVSDDEDALRRIDQKCGAVLTHISMMIAAAAFLFSSASESQAEQVFLGLEIACYLLLAVLCLRCLYYRDYVKDVGENDLEGFAHKAALRFHIVRCARYLNFVIGGTIILTTLLMLSVLVHVWL